MYSEILTNMDVESKDSKTSNNKHSQRAAALQGVYMYISLSDSRRFLANSRIRLPALLQVVGCEMLFSVCLMCNGVLVHFVVLFLLS